MVAIIPFVLLDGTHMTQLLTCNMKIARRRYTAICDGKDPYGGQNGKWKLP